MNKPAFTLGRVILTLLTTALAVVVVWHLVMYYMFAPWTRDGHVRANVIQIAPDVSGLISTVSVQDNQSVSQGDVLFTIDQARFELALAQAQATLDARKETLAQASREAQRNKALGNLVAREQLEEQARKALERARELGAEDSLIDFDGLSPQMVEALAEDGVKTLEDFATCADWELAGGWTTENGQRVKDDGLLEKFDVSLEEAQTMVMTARVLLGWVDPTELEAEEEPTEDAEDEQTV